MFRNQEKTKIQYLKEVYIIFAIFASDAPSPLAMAKLKRHPKHIRFVYKANQTKVNLSSYFDHVWSQTQFSSLPLKRHLAGSTRQIDTGQILDFSNFIGLPFQSNQNSASVLVIIPDLV